jgi:beta-aspartyl-peptidase (threonine type)
MLGPPYMRSFMVKPFIIGTHNAGQFLYAGVDVLKAGGSALDAVEAATRLVESNPDDSSVGMGGIPNILGVQEMDASLMCGRTLRTGAVGALKGFLHPISVARKVLEEAPHVMLVGEGAELFARAMGCEEGSLETETSRKVYEAFVADAFEGLDPSQEWVVTYVRSQNLREWYDRLADKHHGTVNIQAMDENGDIASAVSTSGTALKFPGRLGDSPVIGAGNYCDNRYGAAACTGRGEDSLSLREACFRAMKDIHALKSFGGMNCLAMDSKGNTASASTREDRESTYWYMGVGMHEPEKRIGINVKP